MLIRGGSVLEARSVSRRRFLASASVAALALAGGTPRARAQSAVTLRISSSLPADQNAAHYPWYQRFAANLQGAIGNGIAIEYFPNSQLGKEADVVQQVKVGSKAPVKHARERCLEASNWAHPYRRHGAYR